MTSVSVIKVISQTTQAYIARMRGIITADSIYLENRRETKIYSRWPMLKKNWTSSTKGNEFQR